MKKILLSCVLAFSFGWSNEYTQGDRVLDMQKMAHAMQDIQSGFFYNNVDIIIAGAEDLKSTIVKIDATKSEKETKDIYAQWMNHASAISGRTKRKILKYSDDLIEHFKAGDAQFALNIYNRISAECMKCHTSLRKW